MIGFLRYAPFSLAEVYKYEHRIHGFAYDILMLFQEVNLYFVPVLDDRT